MTTVALFDPAVGGINLGDQIIVEAVTKELRSTLGPCHLVHVSLHQGLRKLHRRIVTDADVVVVAGSNMLNLRMWPIRGESRWKIPYEESRWLRDVVLFGVGWAGHAHRPNWFGVDFYRRVLSRTGLHSVRDRYTQNMLQSYGHSRVLFTACPSMWGLTPQHINGIPTTRGESVVTTVSSYNRDARADKAMLDLLAQMYERVYVWPQGVGDLEYLAGLENAAIRVGSSLGDYDSLLRSDEKIDYCGTRLHAGIRALQHRRRALVVAIDDRARDLAADTGLPTMPRGLAHGLADALDQDIEANIVLPDESIELFRDSLGHASRSS